MITVWKKRTEIRDRVFIPKYYDPSVTEALNKLNTSHFLLRIGDLIDSNALEVSTGDEIGKMAYGTGDIPFVRTSDISNWEIKSTPKQGISEGIYKEYKSKQNVQPGDILLVRDGTYLIGTNCIVSTLDARLLYQSHILKFRVLEDEEIDPYILFLSLNTPLVQQQIRNIQFTADTIDTIGNRYIDVLLPVPKDTTRAKLVADEAKESMDKREVGKAFIKQAAFLIEHCLIGGSTKPITDFLALSGEELKDTLKQDTVTAEFGDFETFWQSSKKITERILLPKYYEPSITTELNKLTSNCDLITVGELEEAGRISLSTGDEIGKMAYGTGSIPFLRTSDFSNWEIKHDPKQGISEEIYKQYSIKQDLKEDDILLVRDGTYLVGTSCIVTSADTKALFCGGLYKIRTLDHKELSPFLLLGLLNSYIVKRQFRTKQFTRDVIDTLGQRVKEVTLPIPRSVKLRQAISENVKSAIDDRIQARVKIRTLSDELAT